MGNLGDRGNNLKQITKSVVNKGGFTAHCAELKKDIE